MIWEQLLINWEFWSIEYPYEFVTNECRCKHVQETSNIDKTYDYEHDYKYSRKLKASNNPEIPQDCGVPTLLIVSLFLTLIAFKTTGKQLIEWGKLIETKF